tara:strand:+ start:4128 stop:5018 length:891 start_codon:yes stop_codon:yes gene_type:complete
MSNLSQVLDFVKIRGPIIPIQAAKEVGTNILMASAMLSELSSKGQVIVSTIKIGGSPLYYVQGQEIKLQSYISHLNDKLREAYDKLKTQHILEDTKLNPVMRTALRQLKDFAKPLEVTTGDNKTVFWKWYLTSQDDASQLIKKKMGLPTGIKKNIPAKITKIDKKKQIKDKTQSEKSIKPLTLEKPKVSKKIEEDSFLELLMKYFAKNKVQVKNHSIIRKNKEIDFILDVPTSLGDIKYFAKAKDKKTLSESDLSASYGISQLKKLPGLLLITGNLSKKAQESALRDYQGIKIVKL